MQQISNPMTGIVYSDMSVVTCCKIVWYNLNTESTCILQVCASVPTSTMCRHKMYAVFAKRTLMFS